MVNSFMVYGESNGAQKSVKLSSVKFDTLEMTIDVITKIKAIDLDTVYLPIFQIVNKKDVVAFGLNDEFKIALGSLGLEWDNLYEVWQGPICVTSIKPLGKSLIASEEVAATVAEMINSKEEGKMEKTTVKLEDMVKNNEVAEGNEWSQLVEASLNVVKEEGTEEDLNDVENEMLNGTDKSRVRIIFEKLAKIARGAWVKTKNLILANKLIIKLTQALKDARDANKVFQFVQAVKRAWKKFVEYTKAAGRGTKRALGIIGRNTVATFREIGQAYKEEFRVAKERTQA